MLGIQNPRDTLAKVLEDDEKGVDSVYTLGGIQQLATVSESGLYALIFRSRKASAKVFRRWVTSEVLPAIRKTGQYAPPVAEAAAISAPHYIGIKRASQLDLAMAYHHWGERLMRELPIVPLPPPKGATIEGAIGKVLAACIRYGCASAICRAARIAKRCCDLGEFPDLITTVTPVDTGRLMHTFRRYFGRWLLVDDEPGLWISVTPLPGEPRRYFIRQLQQRHAPARPALEIGGAR